MEVEAQKEQLLIQAQQKVSAFRFGLFSDTGSDLYKGLVENKDKAVAEKIADHIQSYMF